MYINKNWWNYKFIYNMIRLSDLNLHEAKTLDYKEMKDIQGGTEEKMSQLTASGPKIDACRGEKEFASCSFIDNYGNRSYGRCVWSSFSFVYYCSDLN